MLRLTFLTFLIRLFCIVHLSHATEDEYDDIIEILKSEKLAHSGSATITKTRPCLQISVNSAVVEKAISHLSKKVVEVDPANKFNLAYCGGDGTDSNEVVETCAVNSLCTTVYRWRKAKTRSLTFGKGQVYVEDKVLLPASCMCVIGQANNGSKHVPEPIIII